MATNVKTLLTTLATMISLNVAADVTTYGNWDVSKKYNLTMSKINDGITDFQIASTKTHVALFGRSYKCDYASNYSIEVLATYNNKLAFGQWRCVGYRDFEIRYDEETSKVIIKELRKSKKVRIVTPDGTSVTSAMGYIRAVNNLQ